MPVASGRVGMAGLAGNKAWPVHLHRAHATSSVLNEACLVSITDRCLGPIVAQKRPERAAPGPERCNPASGKAHSAQNISMLPRPPRRDSMVLALADLPATYLLQQGPLPAVCGRRNEGGLG